MSGCSTSPVMKVTKQARQRVYETVGSVLENETLVTNSLTPASGDEISVTVLELCSKVGNCRITGPANDRRATIETDEQAELPLVSRRVGCVGRSFVDGSHIVPVTFYPETDPVRIGVSTAPGLVGWLSTNLPRSVGLAVSSGKGGSFLKTL